MSAEALPDAWRRWIEQTAGVELVAARRLFGGGSRETYLVDARRNDDDVPLILKLETGEGSHAGTSFSLAREFEAYAALSRTPVPTPRAYGLSPQGDALLLERLAGESDFRRLTPDAQRTAAADFMTALAELHRLDPAALALPGFARPTSPQDHARRDIARWRALAQTRTDDDEPLVRYAFAWLDAAAPAQVQRTCLVQGDTGPGNFLVHDGRVTGLIDWEFSHIGDPMSDLGWLKVRCRTDDQHALFAAAFGEYERRSGLRVDDGAVAYHHALALLRCAVTVAMGMRSGGALGAIQYRIALQGFLGRLGAALAPLVGAESAAAETLPETPADAVFDDAVREIDSRLLPALQDRRARIAAHSVRAALLHLRLRAAHGAAADAADAADQQATFGRALAPAALCRHAEAAGAKADGAVLCYLLRRTNRRARLWAALGA